MAEQLPLQFEHRVNRSFNNFYPGNNQEVVDHLKNCIAGSGEQQIYIWGGKGLGKSHLLQAASQLAQEQKKTTFYYAFTANALPSTDILAGIDEYEIVCFDNIEAIAGDDNADVPALKGWRREIFGEHALALKHGKVALTADGPVIRVVPLTP